MFPTAAKNVVDAIRFTPGTDISRRSSGQLSASWAITRSTDAISLLRKAQAVVERLAFLDRQLEFAQPRPARLAAAPRPESQAREPASGPTPKRCTRCFLRQRVAGPSLDARDELPCRRVDERARSKRVRKGHVEARPTAI